jgi:hypothetical protein
MAWKLPRKRRIQSGASLKEEAIEREIKPHLTERTSPPMLNSETAQYTKIQKRNTAGNTSKKINQTVKEQILGLIMK